MGPRESVKNQPSVSHLQRMQTSFSHTEELSRPAAEEKNAEPQLEMNTCQPEIFRFETSQVHVLDGSNL